MKIEPNMDRIIAIRMIVSQQKPSWTYWLYCVLSTKCGALGDDFGVMILNPIRGLSDLFLTTFPRQSPATKPPIGRSYRAANRRSRGIDWKIVRSSRRRGRFLHRAGHSRRSPGMVWTEKSLD